MLLHESCHFYGLQWLICLFKFSIKPGGTGRIRKGEQCSVVLALRAPRGDTALPDLGSSGYSADSSHSPEQGCGARLADSFQTAQRKCKSKYFVSPPDKSFCLFLSFVQVALSRVMPLKCQLSVWACIALDRKYSSPHTKTAVSRSVVQKEIKYGACTSLFPGGPVHLLFVRVTDVFQMMVSHVCWTSTKALPRETARRYTPSDGGNLHGPDPRAARTRGFPRGNPTTGGRGCQGGPPRWSLGPGPDSQHVTRQHKKNKTKLRIHS